MNIFSNLIYSCCIANSFYHTDPARKRCPSFVQVTDIPGTFAPLSLSCTLHSRHWHIAIIRNTPLYKIFFQHRLSSVCSRKLQILWEAVPGDDICGDFFEYSHSSEHNSHTMPASHQRMLFLPHLWPPLSALRSGSLQRGISVTWEHSSLSKNRAGVTEMDASPAQGAGAGKLFLCRSLEPGGRSQTPSEQELHRNTGCLARLFPDNLAAIQHAPRFDHRNGTLIPP